MKNKICIITQPFPSEIVGHIQLSSFIKIFEPLSSKIFVITGISPLNNFSYKDNIHIINIKSTRRPLLVSTFRYILAQLKISAKLIRNFREIDVVIFYCGGTGLIFPIITSKIFKKKVIIIATAFGERIAKIRYYKNHFFAGIIYRIIGITGRISYPLVDLIGIAMKSESIISHFGLHKYKDKISPFGAYFLDPNFNIKKEVSERENIIGYVGRLSKEKGVLELAKAIPLILSKTDDVEFLIVGDGPLMSEMKKELQSVGYIDKVRFVGFVPYEKIPDYLNKMKFHILPSHTEAFGGTAIEAMACGAISIANSVGGLPDVIANNKTGFLLKDNQPQTIANKVLDVWDDPKLEKIQKNAKEFVDKTFSYEAAVERCEKAFSDLVEA